MPASENALPFMVTSISRRTGWMKLQESVSRRKARDPHLALLFKMVWKRIEGTAITSGVLLMKRWRPRKKRKQREEPK